MATKASNEYRIYVDGNLWASETDTSQIPGGITAALTIGRAENLSLNGKLDDIRFYNRALSASEVQQLYLTTAGDKTSGARKQNSSRRYIRPRGSERQVHSSILPARAGWWSIPK